MASEKSVSRSVEAHVKLRLVTFTEARRLMEELEAQWAKEFPDVEPVNAQIIAVPAPDNYFNLLFVLDNKGKI